MRTVRKFQVYFIAFPDIAPIFPGSEFAGIGGGSPLIETHPYDDEKIQDGAMEMADWALETNPALFGLPDETDEYEGYNDASIWVAGAIADATDERRDETEQEPENPACMWRWVRDIEIVPGVAVRAAYFEYEARS